MTILSLFLNDSIRTGGHRRFIELLSGLAFRGNRIVLLTAESFRDSPSGVESIPTKVSHLGGVRKARVAFANAARSSLTMLRAQVRTVDAVLVFGETNSPAARILADAYACPLVFGLRSNSFRVAVAMDTSASLSTRFRAVLEAMFAFAREYRTVATADRIVFQSSYDRNDFKGRFPSIAKRSGIVRNAFIEPWFSPDTAFTHTLNDSKRLLFVGNTSDRKGLAYLLDALRILNSKGESNHTLDIVGVDVQAGSVLLKSLGFPPTSMLPGVHFLGKQEDVFKFMATSGLLIVPSVFDSYPNVILEALHVGLPILATRTGGIPDMLGENALMVPPRDAKALAEVLKLLLNDSGRYEKLRKDCSERRSHFSFDWFEAWEQEIAAAIKPDGKEVRC